jgi:hypothetical protein
MNLTLAAAAALALGILTTSVDAAPFSPAPAVNAAPQIIKVGSRVSSGLIVFAERDPTPDDDLGSPDGYTADETGGGY